MRYFLLSIFAFFAFDVFSQRNVSGVVFELLDSVKVPLVGAAIMEVGTARGILTDFEGEFNFTTSKDISTLRFSFMGMFQQTVEIMQDTVLYVVLEPSAIVLGGSGCLCAHPIRRISIGANYDFSNSMFGLSFGNGYNESPITRISSNFVYKINAQTNFDGDYSFGANLAYHRRLLPIFYDRLRIRPSVGFAQYNFSSQDFFHRDIYASVAVKTLLGNEWIFKTGHQTLNDFNNWGGNIGFQRRFSLFSNFFGLTGYYGVSVGYFNDYWTYSAYIQGRITWNIHYRITYDRIGNHDFFNVGLSSLFSWRRR